MKKMLIFILVVSLFMALPVSAAEPVIKTDGNYYDAINDAFMVNGTIENEIGNVPMTLKISYNGQLVYLTQTVAKSQEGVVSYEFPKMSLSATTPSGTYQIEVRSAFLNTPFTDTINYVGTDLILPIIRDSIVTEITAKDENGLLENLSANKDTLIINYDAIEELKDPSYFASLMFGETYELPEALNDVSDNILVQDALKELRSDIKENLSMAAYFDIDTVEDSKEWFSEYAEYYGYNSEHKMYEYLPAHEDSSFVARVKPQNLKSLSKVKNDLEKNLLLTNVQLTDSTTVISDIITDFPEYFSGFSREYQKLSEDNKGAVWNHLKGTNFATCEALVKAANDYAKKISNNDEDDDDDDGGSWGGSAGGGYGVTGTIAPDASNNELQLVIFSDLPANHWAYAPMLNLYRRNIIKGYGDNTVKPDQAITRAEFIKILAEISLMPIDLTGEDFSDVSENHWAYKYIKSARKTGLVTGGYTNNFNPDERITREDMLVILQRATKAPDGSANFADMGDAASYAKGAIGYFSEKGVVNGMGDNMFMPKGETTRAQACKILNLLYQ